ncbi:MAG: hypothetical protein II937_01275 [Bacteroidales bacterium]|nr:hypothetical protein [Bacteroidales bacterium]
MNGNYIYDLEGILTPQRLLKCELAYFYGKTPRHFRRELENVLCVKPGRYYTKSEVAKIMQTFDIISREDVEAAQPRIKAYLADERERNKNRYLKHKIY